jgi:hypothetical protein
MATGHLEHRQFTAAATFHLKNAIPSKASNNGT